jgi:C1A family cysteine protease
MFYVLLTLFLTVATANIHNEKFRKWADDFKIQFVDDSHRERAFSNWLSNDKYILEINNNNLTYTLGHNHLSGLDMDEYHNYLGFNRQDIDSIKIKIDEAKCLYNCVKNYDKSFKLDTIQCVKSCVGEDGQNDRDNKKYYLPESIDWVEKGAVTPVKDQGQCGSCWSFSTTGALEGAYYVKYGKLESFSEQELVDCDTLSNGGGDHGCRGGLMDNAFSWINKNGGLCSEKEYPYKSGETKSGGSCDKSCSIVEGSKVAHFTDVKKNSDESMMEALSKQTISIAIQADDRDFQLYKSGVFTGSCGTQLDHGVLVVGYGTLDGEDYYLIKNSWSTSWGDSGYIKLGRGQQYNSGSGQCGMLMQASYPEV